jgi:hypothetical protein
MIQTRTPAAATEFIELADRFEESFDLVIFWGVLYHLRHPLLALDNLRAITGGRLSRETAVCDAEPPRRQRARPLARFYRRDGLAGDSSNRCAVRS